MRKIVFSAVIFSAMFQASSFASYSLEDKKQALQNYQEIHSKQIAKRFSKTYSGFNDQYQVADQENSFFKHLTKEDVDFYAALAKDIYSDGTNDENEMFLSVLVSLEKSDKKDYKVLGFMKRNNGELSAGVLYNPNTNHAILVYAGTKSSRDLIVDLKFLGYTGGDRFNVLVGPESEKLNAHSGFASVYIEGIEGFVDQFRDAVNSSAPTIKNHIQSGKKLTVTTVGHSLGGAMSLIAAKDMPRILSETGLATKKDQFSVENISFGAPRVFDAKSAQIVEKMIGRHNIVAFRDLSDPIPMVPPRFLFAEHIGTSICFGKSTLIPNIKNHFMTNYVAYAGETFDQLKMDANYRKFVEDNIVHFKKELGDTSIHSFELLNDLKRLEESLDDAHRSTSFYFQAHKDDQTQSEEREDGFVLINELHSSSSMLKQALDLEQKLEKRLWKEAKRVAKLLGKKSSWVKSYCTKKFGKMRYEFLEAAAAQKEALKARAASTSVSLRKSVGSVFSKLNPLRWF